MSQNTTTTSNAQPQTAPRVDATAASSSGDSSQTQAALELLLQLLEFTKGNVDQAEKMAHLLARLSPGSPISLLIPGQSGGHHGGNGGGVSTQTSVGANTAAAAAASTTGVAVATSVPNSSATSAAVAPSLLTVGSTTSTTAVPFSEISTIPTGMTLNIGVTGAVSYGNATANDATAQDASSELTKQSDEQTQAQRSNTRVQFHDPAVQPESHPRQLSIKSAPGRDFPWQGHQETSDQRIPPLQPGVVQPDNNLDGLAELRQSQSPIQTARIVNIPKRPSRTPSEQSLHQRPAPTKPFFSANTARQRPMSLGPSDPRLDPFLTMEAQWEFDRFDSELGDVSYVQNTLQQTQPQTQPQTHPRLQPQLQPQSQPELQPQLQPQPKSHLRPHLQPHLQQQQQQQQQPIMQPQSQQQPPPRAPYPPVAIPKQPATSSPNSDIEDLESEIHNLKEEVVRLTQQCRAWERIASLSVNLASVEGDSNRASLVSTSASMGMGGSLA